MQYAPKVASVCCGPSHWEHMVHLPKTELFHKHIPHLYLQRVGKVERRGGHTDAHAVGWQRGGWLRVILHQLERLLVVCGQRVTKLLADERFHGASAQLQRPGQL